MENHQKYRTQNLINQWEAKARTAQQINVRQREDWYEIQELDNQGTRTGGNQVQEKKNLLEKKIKAQAKEARNEESKGWWLDHRRKTSQKVITSTAAWQNTGTMQWESKEERETVHKDTKMKKKEDEVRITLENQGGLGKNSWGLPPGYDRG